MHSDIRRGVQMLEAASGFAINHPDLPPNARANALFAVAGAAATEIREMGGTQDAGRNRFRASAQERQQIASSMRKLMGQIARVAKVLDRSRFPEARFKLRVPRSNGYQALLTRAEVYLKTLPAMKSEFIERGMPGDFDARLQGMIDQFAGATARKTLALGRQVGSTAAMKEKLREGVRAVRELDVILSLLLEDDPALYAGWKSSSHIERAPRRSDKAVPAPVLEAALAKDGISKTVGR